MTTLIQNPIRFQLSRPQLDFVGATETYPAFCAGFGAGKTVAAVVRALTLKSQYPKLDVGYYLPSFDAVKTVGHPAFFEVMDLMGIRGDTADGGRVIEVYGAGNIIFRSMEKPEKIVGYKHADAVADELDTLPIQKAREVYRRIIGRNRQRKPDGRPNTIAVASTPEGFRFMYENWHKKPIEGTRLIRASTYSNRRNLPADYISQLLANYPPQLIQAYLLGHFVNLTSGSVYTNFDRTLNATYETIGENEPLHIGMDFNVGNMNAVVIVERNGLPMQLDEITGILDTSTMVSVIVDRYKSKGHSIKVYPDASGKNRAHNVASESDHALLRQAGFMLVVNPSNPRVRDRIIATNQMIYTVADGRRFKINPDKCPHTVEDLEKQAYDDNGEPDKSSGHDHRTEALGYYMAQRFPIKKPVTMINIKRAI